jgi:tRNA (cytosine38-C5)-methyltransferase
MRDSEDPRAASFLHLIRNVFPKLLNPPSRILIENVVNFETSQTRQLFVGVLDALQYPSIFA